MEHQHHSNHLSSPSQTLTTSSPGTWVYLDMTQMHAEPGMVYQTASGNSCNFNELQDSEHYTFKCRCGCGELFAGYGRDIRSAARIDSEPQTPSYEATQSESISAQVEFAMKVRPFVSDRYIQKAIFKLSDDEIDGLAEQRAAQGKVDPVIEHGGGAEDNDPPEVGCTVYSKVTRDGPYTVLDFTMARIVFGDGDARQTHQTWCGVLRTSDGSYIHIPVGDLVKKLPDAPRAVDPYEGLSPRARATAKSRDRQRTEAVDFFNRIIAVMLLTGLAGWCILGFLWSTGRF